MLLSLDEIKTATARQLVNTRFIAALLDDKSEDKLAKMDAVTKRCQELQVYKDFNKKFQQIVSEGEALDPNEKHDFLDRFQNGNPKPTIDNYLKVFEHERMFEAIRYNEMTNCGEILSSKGYVRWSDTNDARAMHLVETKYGFLKEQNYTKAMRIFFDDHKYHPIRDIIEHTKWDGKSRIKDFLHKWTECENTAYTRECSRLIFAGGIHRIYQPGCKFDDMIVLVGEQGEGKSTLIRWLAINDKFFSEVNEVDGQRGIEATEGAWICEVSEMLALTKTKEQEAVKSYLTRQVEHYRMPYDKHVSDRPRQCIFIGTSNKERFLTDRTGNRRYYPVRVYMNGYDLYDKEDECRDYILQCWAEAKELYEKGKIPAYADRSILEDIRQKQAEAEEDDYRIGAITDWLEQRQDACSIQLWVEALNGEQSRFTKKDSSDISLIMSRLPGWERVEKAKRFGAYGPQKYWKRADFNPSEEVDELPF